MNNEWIQTYSGRKFWPLDPSPDDVRIEDIAHALSLKCRFGGMCRSFYSVGDHSLRCALLVSPPTRIHALLHDAAEAYLPDVASPIKRHILVETPDDKFHAWQRFDEVEKRVLDAVYRALDLTAPTPEQSAQVKRADMIMLATEARDLMGPAPDKWTLPFAPLAEVVYPISRSEHCEGIFLDLYRELR